MTASARGQRGLSLISMMIFGVVLAFLLLLGFRAVPAVNEYMAIKRVVNVIAAEGDSGASPTQMRRSFDRYAYTDDIVSVQGSDLAITRIANTTIVDVAYERKIPVAGIVSLLLEFEATSAAAR